MARHDPALDARALLWTGGALVLAVLPHAGRLPPWLSLLFLITLGWRTATALGRLRLPPRWLLMPLTLAVGAGVVAVYHGMLGRDAGVALLAAMAALKLLETRTRRDGLVLVFLGYFLVMGNLLYTQSLPAAGHMLVMVVLLAAAQSGLHAAAGLPDPRELLGHSLKLAVLALPFMLVLFVLFPRLPGPLWNLPDDNSSARTGLSDSMSPGAISQLSRSGAVAFRVSFAGPAPPNEDLYWRGPVLWLFDGRSWSVTREKPRRELSFDARGRPVDYVITLEPHDQRWLFALDLPARLPSRAGITGSYQLLSRDPVDEVLRYEMRSYLDYATGPLSPWQRRLGLQLPRRGNPRARELAAGWRAAGLAPQAIVRTALELYHRQPFFYTLSPPPLDGADTVDRFLFESRRGFCEHYAGSFTFLMRAAGIPARVVTGYQGGERNALGDYWIVRQAEAHAWAEVWLAGQGWVRVDPTAAVAPERVEQGMYAAVSDPETVPFLARRTADWLKRLALGWDAVNNAWNQWVLAYGPEMQRRLARRLGLGWAGLRGLIWLMLAALALVAAVFAGVWLWRQRGAQDPVSRAWERFCAKLNRRGLARSPHEGPVEYTERVARERPELASHVRVIGRLYALLRYGRGGEAVQVRRLARLVRQFRA